jgi:hypothetical protein
MSTLIYIRKSYSTPIRRFMSKQYYRVLVHILRGGKYSGPLVPEFFLCWQKEKRQGRKRGGGGKEKKGKKERKKKERKRIEESVTAPISSHFVQGQTLGVGGAPKIFTKEL